MRLASRLAVYAILAGLVAAAVYLAVRETPVLVDLATVTRGPMEVNVAEEGVTRVIDVFTVSAPIAGELARVTLSEGDEVVADETVVATIRPLSPPFLDERTRAELVAATEAARSAVALAEVEHARALTALKLAQSEYDRAARLAEKDFVSESTLEKADSDVRLQKAQVESAQANIRLRQAELASAQARLTQPTSRDSRSADGECCVTITAPVSGVVLSVIERSEQAVQQGAKLLEIGDPNKLEVTVDLLSRDAVRVSQGARAAIEDWGGEKTVTGRVRRIEPAAFTKVSSLGIEEQRVNVVIDLDAAPEGLGHNYRVLARLRIWGEDDVLQAPIGALFRSGGDWSVFVAAGGVVRLRRVELGRMNDAVAQVVSGLTEGESVVLYPNDQLADGKAVEQRPAGQ